MNAGIVVIIMWVHGWGWSGENWCERFEDESRYGVGRYEAEMGVQRKSKHRVDVRPSWWKAPRQIIISIIASHCHHQHLLPRSSEIHPGHLDHGTTDFTRYLLKRMWCNSNIDHCREITGCVWTKWQYIDILILIARGRLVSQKPVQTQYTFPCQDYSCDWKPFGGWTHLETWSNSLETWSNSRHCLRFLSYHSIVSRFPTGGFGLEYKPFQCLTAKLCQQKKRCWRSRKLKFWF